MRQINVDGLTDDVKRFIIELASKPGGIVIKMEGLAVLCVVPMPPSDDSSEEPWTTSKFDRRCELVDKEIAGTLDIFKAVELAQL